MYSSNKSSLVLGGVASTRLMAIIDEINRINGLVELAEERVDELVLTKQKMTMKLHELKSMGIDTSPIELKIGDIDKQIATVTSDYLSTFLSCQEQIQQKNEEKLRIETEELTAPHSVCLLEGETVSKPLFYDSMKMNSDYFSFNSESSDTDLTRLNNFLVKEVDKGLAQTAATQVSNYIACSDYTGSLVITASCTHKNIRYFEKISYNPYEAANIWNSLHPENEKIVFPVLVMPADDTGEPLTVIRGAAYRSGFVGMIHFFRSGNGNFDEHTLPIEQIREKLRLGSWLGAMSGELGIDESILDDVRSFLISNKIRSHISIVSDGVIPKIKSGEVQATLPELTNAFADMSKQLPGDEDKNSTLTSSDRDNLDRIRRLNAFNHSVSAMLSTMSKQESKENTTFNLNTLLTAFDNYVKGVNGETSTGIPVHYYTCRITRNDILRTWMDTHQS